MHNVCLSFETERLLNLVLFLFSGSLVALVGISDTVKPEAHLCIYTLKRMGMDVVLLTGKFQKLFQLE